MAKKKKSSAYWKKRFSDLENAQNQYAQNTFHQIEPAFDKAQRQIQAQIEAWYGRYAANNGITMAEARKQLSAAELKELKWDVKEYIQYGQENALNQQWMKELENASAKFHISRLEALKIRTQQALEVAFGNELDSLDSMVKALYQSGYYHTCFEIQKGFNLGWEIGQIDERRLEKVVSRPWASDGMNFSDRVWKSKTTMVNDLHQELTRTIIQGKSPDEAIRHMTKYLQDKGKNAKYQAGRLVMTEQAFISSAAQKDAFTDLDVEEFEIVATLDSRTSEICQEMDGQHFPMKDFQPGVTAPPFHVWCRSTTVPYFDDEWSGGERAARGEDGKTYYVPSDMTYKEWKNKFVKSAPLEDIRTPVDIDFDVTVGGYKSATGGHTVKSIGEKYGQEAKVVTLNKRNTVEWDELPATTQTQLKYTSMDGKQFHLAKGDYEVQRYVEGSTENIERDEIAKARDAEYIGFSFQRKNNQSFYIDFYQKGDELFYSIGKADVQKKITDASMDVLEKTMMDREKLIIENIGESNCNNLSVRKGDEWVSAMKEFHRTIQADGKPSILPDAEYDAIQSPTLYRGIAPQSHLRKDITTTSTTKEMVDEFFNGESPFPSRGVYGDGVAYAAPSYKEIAWNYATGGGKQLHGGVIIEFKLKSDARVITYEDAVDIFKQMSKKSNSKLLFNPHQTNAFNKEVGKAMNAMGYDAIIKHNGDNTGIDFYVILNRAALATKKKYITKAL